MGKIGGFFDKLTLYEVLTSMFTGVLISSTLANLLMYLNNTEIQFTFNKFDFTSGLNIAWFLFVSYFLGLLWHKVVECLYCSKLSNKNIDKKWSFFCSPITRNQKSLIQQALEQNLLEIGKKATNLNNLKEDYYKAYYTLWNDGKLGNVPKVESHSAICKDLIFLWPILCVIYLSILIHIGSWDCIWWIVTIAFCLCVLALLIWCREKCELKIHSLIWESYYFIYQGTKPISVFK